MNLADRRTAPVLKIRCKSESIDEFMERYAIDFSHDGVFVKTRSPFAEGTSLRFEFQLQNGVPVLGARGRVTWTRESGDGARPAGMGIAFGEMKDDARALVRRLVGGRGDRSSRYDDRPRVEPVQAPAPPGDDDAIDALPRTPSGLFTALTAKPLELGRSTPLPIAERLRASSAPPPRLAPPPPALPLNWGADGEDEDTSLELSDEAFEPHPAPASFAPPTRGPITAETRDADTMGQLTHLIEEVFHETARRSSRPAAPHEVLDLAGTSSPGALAVDEEDIEEIATVDVASQIEREARRSSGPDTQRTRRVQDLVRRAAREEWVGAPPVTWILFALFLVAAGGVAFAGSLGPEALAAWMRPLAKTLQPLLESLGLW